MASNSSSSNPPSAFGRALAKFKEMPVFYTGSIALATVVGGGLLGLKTRKIRLSLYLINLRLAAQGSFVAILTGGVAYSLFRRYQSFHSSNEEITSPRE